MSLAWDKKIRGASDVSRTVTTELHDTMNIWSMWIFESALMY